MAQFTKEQLIAEVHYNLEHCFCSEKTKRLMEIALAALTAPQLPQPAVPECYQRLLHHAYGMTMGHDWNKGTMAGHHREKLCKAVEDCRAAMLNGDKS